MKKINMNKTDYTDAEIVEAVEEALNLGKQPMMDNYRTEGPMWQRIRYSLDVEMDNGDRISAYWNPTEDGYKTAEEIADESWMCNWDEIDLVEYV